MWRGDQALADGEAGLAPEKAEAGGDAPLGQCVLRIADHPGDDAKHGYEDQGLVDQPANIGVVPQPVE